jgi:hypothetical protein
MSPEARAWIFGHVRSEPDQWLGNLLAMKYRYIGEIVQAMMEDGLKPGADFEIVGCQ